MPGVIHPSKEICRLAGDGKKLISDYHFHRISITGCFAFTGGLSHSPTGQAAGLAVASALVTLGNPRRPSIDLNPKDTNKSKRKQSQHPDNL